MSMLCTFLFFVHLYSICISTLCTTISYVISGIVHFCGEDSCTRGTLSNLLFLFLYISDVNEENDVDSKDAVQREMDVMSSDLGLQNHEVEDQEGSQLEVSECEGPKLKESGLTSKESSHGSAGFHIPDCAKPSLGLPSALSGEKEGLLITEASQFKDGGKSPVVSKSGSQCLVGQRGKWRDVRSNEDDMECSGKGLEDTVLKVQALAKEVEVCDRIVHPVTEQVEATTLEATALEITFELLPASIEVYSTTMPLEAPPMAMLAGAEVVAKPPTTSLSKVQTKRGNNQAESDDLGPENVPAPENLYSAEKRTLKDLSELPRVTDSPHPISVTSRRTRSRAAKELDAEMVTKVTLKKGKGHKVGGTSSQKRARVATSK